MGKITAGGLEARTVYLWPTQWEKLKGWGEQAGMHPATAQAHAAGDLRDSSGSAVLRALVDWDAAGMVESRDRWMKQAQVLESTQSRQTAQFRSVLRTVAAALAQLDPAAAAEAAAEVADLVAGQSAEAEWEPASRTSPAVLDRLRAQDH